MCPALLAAPKSPAPLSARPAQGCPDSRLEPYQRPRSGGIGRTIPIHVAYVVHVLRVLHVVHHQRRLLTADGPPGQLVPWEACARQDGLPCCEREGNDTKFCVSTCVLMHLCWLANTCMRSTGQVSLQRAFRHVVVLDRVGHPARAYPMSFPGVCSGGSPLRAPQ